MQNYRKINNMRNKALPGIMKSSPARQMIPNAAMGALSRVAGGVNPITDPELSGDDPSLVGSSKKHRLERATSRGMATQSTRML